MGEQTVLQVDRVVKHFKLRRTSLLGPPRTVHAVDDVSLTLSEGRTLGVVGESGCGKSTLGRVITGLATPTSGTVTVNRPTPAPGSAASTAWPVQAVFQDPSSSLDPRMRVGAAVGEALAGGDRGRRAELVEEMLHTVGLPADFAARFPHQLSGGQQQRVGIARALISDPALVLLDEAVSSLDATLQAQVLRLLKELQRDRGVSYVFISHDLRAVRNVSDSVAVMYLGQVVEHAPATRFDDDLLHPYSVALRSTEPRLVSERGSQVKRIVLAGEPPSAVDPGGGCRFAPRCPIAMDECRTVQPELRELGSNHLVRCHRPGELSPTR